MQQDSISAFRNNLNELQDMIAKAKKMPLSSTMCIVDRERLYNILTALENEMPTSFAEAEGIVSNQISIIAEANEMAALSPIPQAMVVIRPLVVI